MPEAWIYSSSLLMAKGNRLGNSYGNKQPRLFAKLGVSFGHRCENLIKKQKILRLLDHLIRDLKK